MRVRELIGILADMPYESVVEIRTYADPTSDEQYISADVCNVVSCCDGVVLIEAYP